MVRFKTIAWLFVVCLALTAPAARAQDSDESYIPVATPPENAAASEAQLARAAVFEMHVIYTDVAAQSTSLVPGVPGTRFSSFDRPYGSPNGNWILTADTDRATTSDEVLLVNGVVQLFEGDLLPWGTDEHVGLLDTQLGINDAGDWVFATNTDAATTADEYIVQSVGGVLSVAAREGDPIPTLSPPLAGTGPFTWGTTLESPVITTSGIVAFSSDSIGGAFTTENDILVGGSWLLAQEGVTQPSGQQGAEFWENFDLSDFFVSHDGAHWMAQGDLTGDTSSDDVVVVNGTVVLQENVVVPGSSFANPIDGSGIVGVSMTASGDWFARGNNDTSELDWIVRNGQVIAFGGAPISPGMSELWDDTDYSDCFFLHVGNRHGDWVIGGVTNGLSSENGVLMVNGTVVVAREGDPLDLDGNGQYDDDAFINTFGNDDAFFSDSGMLYQVITMRDGTGVSIGDAFVAIETHLPIFVDDFESGDTLRWSQ